mmetsp:Transcript_16015/g.18256  ORF Transcript_16015/g.18256 Transcript_16015/m.18256 type:complete len:83 (-) Transcript_16015:132-380(-)
MKESKMNSKILLFSTLIIFALAAFTNASLVAPEEGDSHGLLFKGHHVYSTRSAAVINLFTRSDANTRDNNTQTRTLEEVPPT